VLTHEPSSLWSDITFSASSTGQSCSSLRPRPAPGEIAKKGLAEVRAGLDYLDVMRRNAENMRKAFADARDGGRS